MPKIECVAWSASFKRAYRKRIRRGPHEKMFRERMGLFLEDPFHPQLRTHKLSGILDGLWSFSVAPDCRVVFEFLAADEALLIDIGTHDEVY